MRILAYFVTEFECPFFFTNRWLTDRFERGPSLDCIQQFLLSPVPYCSYHAHSISFLVQRLIQSFIHFAPKLRNVICTS